MNAEPAASHYISLTIDAIIEEAADFKTFVFAPGHGISYAPGQFLTLVHEAGSEEVRRSYSITSTPVLNEPLSIGVRRIANGIFSRLLIDKTQVGDVLLTTGAGGLFCLPPGTGSFNSIWFFAAGSGITPIYSLLKTVLLLHPNITVFLVYSNRSEEATIFYKELKFLQEKYKHCLTIHFIFSAAANLLKAHLNRDVMLEMLDTYKPGEDTLFYTCGPEAYMRLVIYLLQERGYAKNNIRKEDFVPNRVLRHSPVPPDTAMHRVTLKTKGGQRQFNVKYPDTILTAAKKEKILIPYSCETGKCGSCAARCLRGEVWLSNNEVLTDKDLSQGLTLTCVGYPVKGDVVLQLDV